MQKVFRLLRHNTEQGPYTIGDLLGQQLVPGDLIWVDGESTAWAHPHEMEVLKYAIDVKLLKKEVTVPVEKAPEVKAAVKPVNVWAESPAKEIERKAEEIRQRTLAFKKASTDPVAEWHPQHATIIPLSENDIEFSYHKRKGLPVGEVLMGAMVVGLLTIGWYGGGKELFQQPKTIANAVAVKMEATEANAALGAPAVAAQDTTANSIALVTDSSAVRDTLSSIAIRKAPKKSAPSTAPVTMPEEAPVVVVKSEPQAVKKTEVDVVKTTVPQPSTKEEASAESNNSIAKTEEKAPSEEVEKKKGLGKMLKGLFKKKKKDDDKTSEEVKPDTK